jgi:predicted transcriptional regulator
MYYMTMLTIRIDDALEEQLDAVCSRSGKTRSTVVREALRRHLVREEFRQLRREIMPLAEARGYVTDEDLFEDVS